jgi:hypothetical protein
MGNCPSGFQVNPAQGMTCVIQCPSEKGFETAVVDQMPTCRYRNDKSVFVKLLAVSGVSRSLQDTTPMTLSQLRTINPDLYNQYKQAQEQFNKEFPIALSKVEKQQQIEDAFKELQSAENVRDQSPQAYQDARIRYYTLVKGKSWINEETERITNSEVAPTIIRYMKSYQDMNTRISQQRQTIDVVNNVTDKVISMKDEFEHTTNVFSKQIDALKNQINIEKKHRQKENKSWMDFLLNVVIVLAGIAAVVVLARRVFFRKAYTQTPGYYQ